MQKEVILDLPNVVIFAETSLRMPSEDEGFRQCRFQDCAHPSNNLSHLKHSGFKNLGKSNLIFFFLSNKGFWDTTKKKT